MKHTQRMLAILLAFALALGLALPASAAVNWDDFYQTTGMPKLIVKHGQSITIIKEVNIPDGVDRVEYQWYQGSYDNGKLIEGATTATLQLAPDHPEYPNPSNSEKRTAGYRYADYYCVYIAFANGDSKTLRSGITSVRVEGTFWDKLYSITIYPFVSLYTGSGAPLIILFTVFFPLVIPFFVFAEFINNVMGLFGGPGD